MSLANMTPGFNGHAVATFTLPVLPSQRMTSALTVSLPLPPATVGPGVRARCIIASALTNTPHFVW